MPGSVEHRDVSSRHEWGVRSEVAHGVRGEGVAVPVLGGHVTLETTPKITSPHFSSDTKLNHIISTVLDDFSFCYVMLQEVPLFVILKLVVFFCV